MRPYILPIVSCILLFVIVALTGGVFSHGVKLSVALFGYTAVTYYWLNRPLSARWIVGILAVLPLFLYGPLHVVDFRETALSLPASLAHLVGIVFGFLLHRLRGNLRYIGLAVVVFFTVYAGSEGYRLWANKVTHGTFSGRVVEQTPDFRLRTERGEVVTPATLRNKVIVLDFWNTGCAPCFRKFPQLQQYYTKYRNNDRVQFYAVNIPLKRDTIGQAAAVLKKHGYTFPVLYADKSSVAGTFDIQVFPTVLVMDDKQRIVYRGELSGVEELIDEME